MIRLLIVDDQSAVRQGLHMLLTAEPDFQVVGEASDGEGALCLAQTLNPDVVLMDVEMLHADGIATTQALRTACPHVAVIMLTIHDDARTRERAQQAGAVAFVPKSFPTDVLLAAIRRLAH